MSQIEELVLSVVRSSNGISAYMATNEINRKYGDCITRQQVSGALQRLRQGGLVEHFGGWTITKGEPA